MLQKIIAKCKKDVISKKPIVRGFKQRFNMSLSQNEKEDFKECFKDSIKNARKIYVTNVSKPASFKTVKPIIDNKIDSEKTVTVDEKDSEPPVTVDEKDYEKTVTVNGKEKSVIQVDPSSYKDKSYIIVNDGISEKFEIASMYLHRLTAASGHSSVIDIKPGTFYYIITTDNKVFESTEIKTIREVINLDYYHKYNTDAYSDILYKKIDEMIPQEYKGGRRKSKKTKKHKKTHKRSSRRIRIRRTNRRKT